MIKSVIIDDEPKAIELIKNYIDRLDFICSVSEFRNPLEAFYYLEKEPVDLIFLDINMPMLSGIELYKNLKQKPPVIFTTAYSNYAIEGFELEALDYLVKPIQFPRFLQSCNRLKSRIKEKQGSYSSKIAQLNDLVFVKSGNKKHSFFWREILYLEKDENYVKYIQTSGKQILSRQTLGEIENLFPFYIGRIHKSYAVSLIHFDEIRSNLVMLNGKKLPLGRTYKKAFIEKVERFKSIMQK